MQEPSDLIIVAALIHAPRYRVLIEKLKNREIDDATYAHQRSNSAHEAIEEAATALGDVTRALGER